MSIKKKSKVTATFNMSSLTDIIFLLLIFFMLTSSLVIPNALNLQLPGTKTPSNINLDARPSSIDIEANDNVFLNGQRISLGNLEREMMSLKRAKGRDAIVTITPAAKATNVAVVAVLDVAYRYEIKAILNDPK
jgi:biopolymer transport protein ExbD